VVGGFHGNCDVRDFVIYLLLGVGQRLVAINHHSVTLVRLKVGVSVLPDKPAEPLSHIQQKSGELYQEYRAYCARTGEYTRSTTDFYTGLDTAGFEKRKSKTGVMVYGIRLKSDFIAD